MSTHRSISFRELFALIELSYFLLVFLDSFPEHRHDPLGFQGLFSSDQFDVLWQLECPQLNTQNFNFHGKHAISELKP